jgi:regulatory protein
MIFMTKTVTDLVVQKKNKQRISVYLDDHYAFSLSPFIAARLMEGQKLDEETVLRLSEEDDLERAYNMALRYLGYRARSLAEMERYLKGKGFPAACRRTTMERLINNRFLNDSDFAGMWVENRTRMNPKGAYALRQELLEKGIEEDLIDEKLDGFNETDAAFDAVKKKLGQWRNLDQNELRKKIYGFLSLRGFSYETTRDTTERALSFIKGDIDGATV